MSPDPRHPIEPTPRFPDGPPAFVPPPTLPMRAAGASPARPEPPRPAARPVQEPKPRWPLPRGPARRSVTAALISGGVALAIYVWGAAPTVLSGDSAELAATAFRGGVPHPT